MGGLPGKLWIATVAAILLCAVPAYADFPYGSGPNYSLAPGVTPNDVTGDGNDWKFAATPEAGSPYTTSAQELFGVRGAHVVDSNPAVGTAWQTTVGRPDVTIAVLDSGIKWYDQGSMADLRSKILLNKGELPAPRHDLTTALVSGVDCSTYRDATGGDYNQTGNYDINADGVFNVLDYACDSRVNLSDPRRVGPPGFLTPEDLIIAFSDGQDHDNNGFANDIAGWDFLDNDNDPYDDVQYGHGTGEAQDSSSEANNANKQAGGCPNCMVLPLRVGDSFVADANNFGQAAIYAVDRNIDVIQEALGALNQTHLARAAVDYAYRHGVPVIASAADEAAQHHNWPSNYAHTIVVNSVNQYNTTFTPANRSYLQFNGCTNFSTKITLAIPSSSCSSNATGLGAGYAGLVISAALNAHDQGRLSAHPNCERANGQPCVLSVDEIRQLMASGTIDATPQSDDVNFTTQPEASCSPPTAGCTDPNGLFADANANRPVASPLATTKSYPARKGYDEFYGYGRANIANAVGAANAGTIPPEAEITSPDWYQQIDPTQPALDVHGLVYARGNAYTCKVYVAPGSEPNNGFDTDTPAGDFHQVSSNWCDGATHSAQFQGSIASISVNQLKTYFPTDAGSFNGNAPVPGAPNFNGRPNNEPHGFTVRVIVRSVQAGKTLTGEDRRNLYLHRDQDMLAGFPKYLPSDGESSPHFADLNADNRNELIFATSDGYVHALRPDGSELPGWPVHGDALPLHTSGHGFTSGEVDQNASYGAILATVSVADLDHNGTLEVIAADMEGKLYVWNADGSLRWKTEANPNYSGKPLQPFVNVRQGRRYRTQHGFLAAPVVADLDGDGTPEIIAAGMDRHVYAWHADGTSVGGFPVLVLDRSKITAIDPTTHAPTFASGIGSELDQGAIIDTPAVADINGDGKPEIVVGTNEEYQASADGGFNAGNLNTASLSLLGQTGQLKLANSRLYAIKSAGDPGGPGVNGPSPFLTGWPVKVGFVEADLLPVVGEGITGSPVIGSVNCTVNGGSGPKAGVISAAGPAYLWNPDGSSCYGQTSGHDNAMQTDFPASTNKYDTPVIPAVGEPAFGSFAGGTTFLAPAAGLIRALDVGVNEYQGGQDFIAAWDPQTGQFRPGFPSPVNDLQFLTGPSVGDLDGQSGEEIVGGTASLDLYGMNAAGLAFSPTAWPKLTSDWTIANPAVGTFGSFDTDSSAHKALVGLTRSGTLFAYSTAAPACSSSSWPTFHHDPANSGDFGRDAILPGKPYNLALSGNTLTFNAPGDDLLCGTADHYEVVQSNAPITASNFSSADPVAGAPATAAPGTSQSMPLPATRERFIAIRAVDDQGNVGPPATIENPNYVRPRGATPLVASLTTAYKPCTGPNRTHGAPLSFGSCIPPQQASDQLTVGTPDANGRGASSIGSLTYRVLTGDVQIAVSITDVRKKSDLSDYTGELQADQTLRITDRQNGPSQSEPGTVQDMHFPVATPCVASASTSVGSTCSITTTANSLTPGAVGAGMRTIWQLGQVQVFDGGASGVAGSSDAKLFEDQGVFVP